LNRRKRR